MMDGIVMVILVAAYFLFLIICYFMGERQGVGVFNRIYTAESCPRMDLQQNLGARSRCSSV